MMISSVHYVFLVTLLLHLSTTTFVTAQSHPKALVIPVQKDTNTLQYILKINQRTPQVSTLVSIDLKTTILWSRCTSAYISSRHPFKCSSPECTLTNSDCRTTCDKPSKPACTNTDCNLFFANPFNLNSNTNGLLISDIIRINSTNGANVGKIVSAPNVLSGCAKNSVKGLAKGVKGIAGFGRSKTSLPSQLSSNLKFPNKFALCLDSNWSTGVVFFGDGRPYRLYPGPEDITTLFSYTPLLTNPTTPTEYFIGVTSIIVNKTTIPIPKSVLSLDTKTGTGGTKISTVSPYTVLHSTIYEPVTTFFDQELHKFSLTQVKRINSIPPFKLCYDSNSLFFTRIGVVVPDIKLVLQSDKVVWTIFGNNAMVRVGGDAICLGILDGGTGAKTAVVIGGYQMEQNLLEFDLEKNRLGFTSSLQYTGGTTCNNFNFTLVGSKLEENELYQFE